MSTTQAVVAVEATATVPLSKKSNHQQSSFSTSFSPKQNSSQQNILSSSSSNNNSLFDDEMIDVESVRQVFGSTSPEDLNRRKAHELRELWMEKAPSVHIAGGAEAKMPRFLLDPKNDNHVAPHAVALQLLLGGGRHQNNGDGLYRRVATADNNKDNYNGHGHGDVTENDVENNNNNKKSHSTTTRSQQQQQQQQRTATATAASRMWPLILIVIAITSLFCQFVLEVFGGAGAIWGCAELMRMRKGGITHPSWDIFSWFALVVGICCLIRFLLINTVKRSDPTFQEKYNNNIHTSSSSSSSSSSFFELAQIVAKDPILFLHPTKGPALSSCCGCYCFCCGSRWCSYSFSSNANANANTNTNYLNNSGGDDGDNVEYAPEQHNPHASPHSLLGGTNGANSKSASSSPQRRTWELSEDEEENEDDKK